MSTIFHTHDEYIKNRQSCRPGSVKWFLLKGKYAICKYVVYVCVNFSLPSFLSVNWNSPRALTRSEVRSYMKSDMAPLGWNHKCKCVIYAYRRRSLFEQFGHKFKGGEKNKKTPSEIGAAGWVFPLLWFDLASANTQRLSLRSQSVLVLTAGVKQSVGLPRTWMACSERLSSM